MGTRKEHQEELWIPTCSLVRSFLCRANGAARLGSPNLFSAAAGGYFEIPLDEAEPDHTTIARTRRLIELETHRHVFAYVLGFVG